MKIWYQSMSRFQTKWKSYPKYLRQILDQIKDPDTEIEVHGITTIGGFADQYRYLEFLETGEVSVPAHQIPKHPEDEASLVVGDGLVAVVGSIGPRQRSLGVAPPVVRITRLDSLPDQRKCGQ